MRHEVEVYLNIEFESNGQLFLMVVVGVKQFVAIKAILEMVRE